jgi:hypothetical protein
MLLEIVWEAQGKIRLIVFFIVKILKRQQFLTDLAFVFRDNEVLSKCLQKMVENKQKE